MALFVIFYLLSLDLYFLLMTIISFWCCSDILIYDDGACFLLDTR